MMVGSGLEGVAVAPKRVLPSTHPHDYYSVFVTAVSHAVQGQVGVSREQIGYLSANAHAGISLCHTYKDCLCWLSLSDKKAPDWVIVP